MQSVNDAQIVNVTPLFLSSNRFPLSPYYASSIVIVPLQVYMHHYNHINLSSELKF